MKRIKKLMLIMVTLAFVLAGMVSVAGAEDVSGGEGFLAGEEGVSEGAEALEEPNTPDEPDGPVEPGEPEELEGTEGLEGTGGPEIKPEGPEEPEGPKGAGIEGDGSQENPWLIKSWDNLTAVIAFSGITVNRSVSPLGQRLRHPKTIWPICRHAHDWTPQHGQSQSRFSGGRK